MKNLITLFIAFILLTELSAQTNEKQRTFSVEVNPLAYAFGGWSIGAAYKPKKIPKWVFNAGVYSFKFPETFVEQIAGNKGKDFNVNLKTAITHGVDYYPWNKERKGFAFGVSAVFGIFEITNRSETGKATYNSLYFVPRTSYTWYVYKSLYIMPWVGVEFHNKISGNTTVGTEEFNPIKFQFSPNLSIGYSFN